MGTMSDSQPITEKISDAFNAVSEYVTGKTGSTVDSATAEKDRLERDNELNKAQDSDRSLGERGSALAGAAFSQASATTNDASSALKDEKAELYKDGLTSEVKNSAQSAADSARETVENAKESAQEALSNVSDSTAQAADEAVEVATTINDLGTAAYEVSTDDGKTVSEVAEIRALETAALIE